MTEQEAQRPLSRRERRLMEAAATESVETQDAVEPQDSQPPVGDVAEVSIDASSIDIDPYDEHGNLRSRREIRELRAQAVAALEAQARASAEAHADEVNERYDAADVPTEALSLEDLEEIAQSQTPGAEPPEPVTQVVDEALTQVDADLDPVEEETVKEPELPTAPEETYSFPDIKPLEEDQPVFDDPASRTVGAVAQEPQETATTAFDDVIERAVADESASVHTSSSSLILPAIPDGEGLAGPIGTTGELFITGSIELPKSLGETGGHLGLQDSLSGDHDEEDPVDILELSSLYESSDFDSAPVSAKQAVSTRSSDSTGAVTPEVQKDNKKSIALALTGGGLLLVLVAGGIWLFTSGYFG